MLLRSCKKRESFGNIARTPVALPAFALSPESQRGLRPAVRRKRLKDTAGGGRFSLCYGNLKMGTFSPIATEFSENPQISFWRESFSDVLVYWLTGM